MASEKVIGVYSPLLLKLVRGLVFPLYILGERQQIKWFAYAAAAWVSTSTLAYGIPGVIDTPLWFERVGFALNIVFILAIPISIGIAILRYTLYDIDIIINRTLVYSALTATLVVVYFGGVTVTQTLFQTLTSQEQLPNSSSWPQPS